jgi:hypothetical protein
VLIDRSAQKRLKNPAMVKTSRNAKKTKSDEKANQQPHFWASKS